jgi:integrase
MSIWIAKKRNKWGVGWRDQSGRERWKTCGTKAAARELLRLIQTELALGRDWPPPPPMTPTPLEEVFEAFLQYMAVPLAKRTLASYAYALELALRCAREHTGCDSPPVSVLSKSFLSHFYAWLGRLENSRHARGRGLATIIKMVSVLELAWAWGDDEERWHDIPRPRRLRRPRRRPREVVVPTFAEFDQMLLEVRREALRHAYRSPPGVDSLWLFRLGILGRFLFLRRSAGLLLDGRQVMLEQALVEIPGAITKGGASGRSVPLHPDLARHVGEWGVSIGSIVQPPPLELTGRGHSDRSFRRAWTRAGVRPSVWKGRPFHCIRATARSFFKANGVDREVADALLGHVTPGSGPRFYTMGGVLWDQMVEAVHLIPPFPACEED